MKKIIAIAVVAVLLLTAAPLAGFTAIEMPEMDFGTLFPAARAASIVDSGTCGVIAKEEGLDGSQVTWTLDDEGTLTISGTGEISDSAFYNHTELTSLIIENGVTGIGGSAFSGCTGLTNIIIPNSVTLIDWYAFADCTNLTSIIIPNSVKTIMSCIFSGCTNLTRVTIPESVTGIGRAAFKNCTSLTHVTIPASVTSISGDAFSGCAGITKITVEEGNPVYYAVENCLIETETKTLILGCQNSVIPTDGSVTSVDGAFYGCTNLITLTIPSSVTYIGYNAFRECTSLTNILIPDSVTNIESSSFSGCIGLTRIEVEKGNPVYHAVGNCLIETETKTLILGCQDSVIPTDGSVTSIDGAFFGCTGLTNVTIPSSVKSIGHFSFDGCTMLKDVYFIGSKQQWSTIQIGINNECLTNATVHFIDSLINADNAKEVDNNVFIVSGTTSKDLAALAGDGASIAKADGTALTEKDTVGSGMTLTKPDGTKLTIVIKGDNDGDGKISSADARLALRRSVSLEQFTDWQTAASLVGGNDKVTSAEARLILRASVGLEKLPLA